MLDANAVNAVLDQLGLPQVEPIFADVDSRGNGKSSYWRQAFGPVGGYFPNRADRYSVSGGVVLECAVSTSGFLSHCKTLIEPPTGFGFVQAAAKMIGDGYLTTKPATGAHDGDRARILIQFIDHRR